MLYDLDDLKYEDFVRWLESHQNKDYPVGEYLSFASSPIVHWLLQTKRIAAAGFDIEKHALVYLAHDSTELITLPLPINYWMNRVMWRLFDDRREGEIITVSDALMRVHMTSVSFCNWIRRRTT